MITKKDLDKEAEIFGELITDILENTNANDGHIRDILMWHERGRDEVIKAMEQERDDFAVKFAIRVIGILPAPAPGHEFVVNLKAALKQFKATLK